MDIQQEVFEFDIGKQNIKKQLGFMLDLVEAIGLTPVGITTRIYPLKDGSGGNGVTATVEFVESYAVLDTWPELNYAHLNITSCKRFSVKKVKEQIKKHFKSKKIRHIRVFKRS